MSNIKTWALQTQRDMWESMFKEVRAERDALQAKLSAIEAQEPELWARYPRTGRNTPPEVVTKKPEDADSWVAFYAHPVAPAQPVNELMERAQGEFDGGWRMALGMAIDATQSLVNSFYYKQTGREVNDRVQQLVGLFADMKANPPHDDAPPVAPAQPVNELVEALEHAVEIAEGKRDGTWDDLLQYRATIAHAKLDKLTALSEQADLYSEFTKAAQPLTKEQVEKVFGALVDADKYVSLDSVDEAIEIMKGVRT